jgi:hypothetical protein
MAWFVVSDLGLIMHESVVSGKGAPGDGTVPPKTDGDNTPVPQDGAGVVQDNTEATRAWERIYNLS